MRTKSAYFAVFLAIFLAFLGISPAWAETTPTRDQLEAELLDVQAQINKLEKQLTTTKTEKQALTKKINQLKAEQTSLRSQINSTAQVINALDVKIGETEKSIKSALSKIDRLKLELTALIVDLNRETNNIILSLLEAKGFAGVFERYQTISNIARSVTAIEVDLKNTKTALDKAEARYSGQKDDAKELLSVKKLQQQALLAKLGDESNLLETTKGQEAAYQSQLADRQKHAAEIRNRIYSLFESNKTITFGQAVEIAQSVEKMTGVRAAFLLAILTQESNLGKNVGTCNRAGDPPEKSWKAIMKPDRDQEPFKQITAELGLDIDTTPVSCPMKDSKGNRVGWGGAMGPAQFIPSTWMGYRAKVTALTGAPAANPWDIRDAFVAAGIKLRDGGALQGISGEWRAAMIYFSGSTNVRFRFYGDNVAKLAEKYTTDINDLKP